jgi:hypothetical protein
MAEVFTVERVLWIVTVFSKAGLVALLLYRRNHSVFPFFFIYAFLNFLQSIAIFESYRVWGFGSEAAMGVAWGTQGLVTLARAVAVAEICHRMLAKFRGIWGLGWRLLLAAATCISFYAWAVSRGSWQFAILNLDRGLELAMATAIVVLFLFVRYYEAGVEPAARTIAMGFFLYSCFRVVNDTFLEGWLQRYVPQWNVYGTLGFLASMALWGWAFRRTQPEETFEPALLSEDLYRTMAPEINAGLRALNEQLSHFWHTEGKRT